MSQRLERILLGPGPSNAPPQVLAAMARPLLGHLDPEFLEILDATSAGLRELFGTENRLTFAVSGTGSAGMEACLVNTLEPGDTAIVCVNGVFGTRMCDVAARAGASVVRVEAPWGSPIDPKQAVAALEANPAAKVFAIVHAETSTGVLQPLDEIAAALRDHSALFVLDCVTSLAGVRVAVDEWGVDACYSGTQKCLSVPPGLSPVSFSERAVAAATERASPVQSWYLDVGLLGRYWGSDRVYHHTAPVAMVQALAEALSIIRHETLAQRWRRHAEAGAALQEGLQARGFEYVPAKDVRLPMLHCVRLPAEAGQEAPLRRRLLDEYGIEVGGGLGEFAGTCWRVGLMGHNATRRNVALFLAAVDDLLAHPSS